MTTHFDGRYEIIESRTGGMSIVLKARDRTTGTVRAIKYAKPDAVLP
jgi:hypothetical protein